MYSTSPPNHLQRTANFSVGICDTHEQWWQLGYKQTGSCWNRDRFHQAFCQDTHTPSQAEWCSQSNGQNLCTMTRFNSIIMTWQCGNCRCERKISKSWLVVGHYQLSSVKISCHATTRPMQCGMPGNCSKLLSCCLSSLIGKLQSNEIKSDIKKDQIKKFNLFL